MKILGLSAYFHDSAAVVLDDGVPRAAAQEERFTRRKFDAGFPAAATEWCLSRAGWTLDDLDAVAFYEKPGLKFRRLLATHLKNAPHGFQTFRRAMPDWIGRKLWTAQTVRRELARLGRGHLHAPILFAEHHQSHAAAAFYPSPFERAAVLTLDGVGEWATASVCRGDGATLTPEREMRFPHSPGLLYTAMTQYLGFKVLSGEYKVMGLAPYGQPRFVDLLLENVVALHDDGSFTLDMRYFDYEVGSAMVSPAFEELMGRPLRKGEDEPLDAFHMDLAASIQNVIEEIVLRMVRDTLARQDTRNLCLAGGVALNCVANGRVLRETDVRDIWVQPAAGDAGGALGAAYAAHHTHFGAPRPEPVRDAMQGAYLGPAYPQPEILRRLQGLGARLQEYDEDTMIARTVEALSTGKAVGWFQGAMEFGPRALGARSILADPRSARMQKLLNLKVKYRESFRPFAPAVLAEDVADWFEHDGASPYMLMTTQVRARHLLDVPQDAGADMMTRLAQPRSTIPAVTHVDNSARLQTVHSDTNPRFHRLLSAFKAETGCPVLVNTSFNIRGEPIVCTPEDAFRCFMGTEIELLVAGLCVMDKSAQDRALLHDYKDKLEAD